MTCSHQACHSGHVDSTSGQKPGGAARSRSAHTRQRLLDAAAGLIAEVGWGRVTTRAIAEAAGLPHGAVSYHFASKQELLVQAALDAVERMFSLSELRAVRTLPELMPVLSSAIESERDDQVLAKVLPEAMREAARDQVLRDRIAALLQEYRRTVSELVRDEQRRGAVVTAPAPMALATLVAAVGDGLLLHSLLDLEVDVAGAAEALLALVTGEGTGNAPDGRDGAP